MGRPAARSADSHVCSAQSPAPHAGGFLTGSGLPTVLIGGRPAARVGEVAVCTGAPLIPNGVATGSSTVKIGGIGAARAGDVTQHGGTIVGGETTVLVGD